MIGKFTTPTVETVFTKVNTPDVSFGKEVYTASVKLSDEDLKELNMLLAPSLNSAAKMLSKDGTKVTKKDLKVPIKSLDDGYHVLYAKVAAKGVNRKTNEEFTNSVNVLDANGEKLTEVPLIGRGSKVKLSADVVPYSFDGKTGVSFRLKQLMIVDLKEVEKKDAVKVPF